MQVGTLESAVEEKVIAMKRDRSLRSPGGRSGGNSGGGNGGNDSGSDRDPIASGANADPQPDKSRIIAWFLLLVVLMTFGGLIGAYVMVSTNRALEWRPFELPGQVWFSTAMIVASSVFYELGRRAVESGDLRGIRRYLVTTTALGGVFIASQIVLWLTLVNKGLYMRGNPYAGFFYILTAAHAVHVLGGVVALGSILLRSWYPTMDQAEWTYRRNLAQSVGWYWHFMGGLWVCLFILLAFWK